MKKLLIVPCLLCCALVFANNGKAKNKKAAKAVAKEQKAVKAEAQQAGNKAESIKGTPVVTYKNYEVNRRGSKQIVPVQ